METIKSYVTGDIGASQSLVTLECFIGDVDNAELVDDSTVDTSDAVTAINGLIFALESRDAIIERLSSRRHNGRPGMSTYQEMLTALRQVRSEGDFRDEPTRNEAVLEIIGQTLDALLAKLSEQETR